MGRFGRPQGLKGFLRVISFADPEQSLLHYSPWYIQKDNIWTEIVVTSSKVQNNMILAQVAGYTEREEAATLTHVEIGVLRSQLPTLPAGDYYWQEILQMQVYNRAGTLLGQVTTILPTGANDVLVVCGDKRHLIPYIPDVYVLSVDLIQQKIVVDWDEDF